MNQLGDPWITLNIKGFGRKPTTMLPNEVFGDEAEDFAQEFALRYLESGGTTIVKFYFIDYSRELRTAQWLLSSPQGYLSKNVRVSLDQPCGKALAALTLKLQAATDAQNKAAVPPPTPPGGGDPGAKDAAQLSLNTSFPKEPVCQLRA